MNIYSLYTSMKLSKKIMLKIKTRLRLQVKVLVVKAQDLSSKHKNLHKKLLGMTRCTINYNTGVDSLTSRLPQISAKLK